MERCIFNSLFASRRRPRRLADVVKNPTAPGRPAPGDFSSYSLLAPGYYGGFPLKVELKLEGIVNTSFTPMKLAFNF
ncbi:hypothetical protein RRG08_056634 [Elysia crispata]|uniref:Uncharacterized protein n=1 Tax=Elysia crispata TaxID=231223 RepID=A0AAE1D412_9GAST|nr:hypothetical protein RRG08_056634 [Elysia crispata]